MAELLLVKLSLDAPIFRVLYRVTALTITNENEGKLLQVVLLDLRTPTEHKISVAE